MTNPRSLPRMTLSLAVLLSACAVPVGSTDDWTDVTEDPLLGGHHTYERPEIGRMFYEGGACTATLLGSARTVVTAAHCVDYVTRAGAGNYGRFTLEPSRGRRHNYTIQRIVSYGSRPGDDDIALLQLSRAVPSSVATPAILVPANPSRGEPVTVYGYGCRDRDGRSGSGRKQAVDFVWGIDTEVLCPGDSGGPTVNEDGQLIQVNSAFNTVNGEDIYAPLRRYRTSLRAQVDAWRGSSALVWERGAATPSAPPSGGTCAEGVTDAWTCLSSGTEFTRCDGSQVQRASCPDGSTCTPGSTDFACRVRR